MTADRSCGHCNGSRPAGWHGEPATITFADGKHSSDPAGHYISCPQCGRRYATERTNPN